MMTRLAPAARVQAYTAVRPLACTAVHPLACTSVHGRAHAAAPHARSAAHLILARNAASLLLALLCLCAARAASAQVTAGYPDADSVADAVGAMRITVETARVMREECIGRVAALQPEIDSNYLKWRNADGPLIRKADQYWGELSRKQPGLVLQLAAVEPALRRSLDNMSKAPVQGTGGQPGPVVLSGYCRQHFADLASGIWHVRTPQVYKFLEELP